MIRENMENIPQFAIPEGFAIRNYRSNEGHIWTRIQRAAEPYIDIDGGLFAREFKRDLLAMEDRSFYLTTAEGEEIGTITAWWQTHSDDNVWWQIHWVAIHPDYQGRGLSKPMMSVAMARLKQSHERSFLDTSTGRLAAIKVYLDFGFYPTFSDERSRQVWAEVASVLEHPILSNF